MFDEMLRSTKPVDRQKYKGYATIQTNLGSLNVELHGDRVGPIHLPSSLGLDKAVGQ